MNFLRQAALLMDDGRYCHALELFIAYFSNTPGSAWDSGAKYDMIKILESFDIYLNNEESLESLTKCFLYILNWFPNNRKINNMFGEMLLRNGEFIIAEKYFLKAWSMVDDDIKNQLVIEKNMLYVFWNNVPRWNYRWLNSGSFNENYKKAICKAMNEGFVHILNLSSSCENLNLYAGSHNSHCSVVSLETNPVLQQLGSELMVEYCPNVKYHSLLISDLINKIPNDQEGTRDLIITDMLHSSFLCHGFLETVQNCFTVLMKKKTYKVIPAYVNFYLTGIFSKELDMKYRLNNDISIIQLENECVTNINEYGRYESDSHIWSKFKIQTSSALFLTFRLDDATCIDSLLKETWSKNISIIGNSEGYINCLLVWYDIYVDEEIVITNNSLTPDNELCFEQAIFHCEHPIYVESQKLFHYKASVKNEQFNFICLNDPLNTLSIDSKCMECFKLCDEAISFLNDHKWVNCLIHLSEKILEDSKLYIADFSAFPLLGLLLAKRGHQVYYFFSDTVNLNFVHHLMIKNNIDLSLLNCIAYYQFPNFVSNLKKIDYVMFEPVHQDGSLNSSPLENLAFKKFKPNIFFEEILVHFVLVYSRCLNDFHLIEEDVVKPFEGLTYLNRYSGSEHAYFSKADHEKMSKVTTWSINKENHKTFLVPTTKKGKINGIKVWYTLFARGKIRFSTKKSYNFSTYAFRFREMEMELNEKIEIEGKYGGGNLLSLMPKFMK